MKKAGWPITLFLCAFATLASAQNNDKRQPTGKAAVSSFHIDQQSSIVVDSGAMRPNIVKPTVVAEQHSPSKALYLSFLPGAGQVYNHQAWKVPIIYGIMGGLSYWSYASYQDMKMFKDEYLHRVNGGSPELAGYENYPNANIYNLYVSNNQNFQLAIVLCGIVYGLNLLDAYVYGHLFDFQIDDNISLSVQPSLLSSPLSTLPTSTLAIGINF